MDPSRFDLVETMAFDPHDGVSELERHLARMKASAETFGFPFDRHGARNELQAATFRAGASLVRMRLSPTGAMAIELRPRAALALPVSLRLVASPARDPLRLHRTSLDRGAGDASCFDCLFHEDGFLVEGGFTSLFVADGDRLLTPPAQRVRRGSILRDRLLETGRAVETEIRIEDLPRNFLIGNSAHGLIEARLAAG